MERIGHHFAGVGKMTETGKGATRKAEDCELTRYACCTIVQNDVGARLPFPSIATII